MIYFANCFLNIVSGAEKMTYLINGLLHEGEVGYLVAGRKAALALCFYHPSTRMACWPSSQLNQKQIHSQKLKRQVLDKTSQY